MRIALITRQCWPAVGGVERVVENLGQAYVERGHEVTVVAQCIDEMHFGRMTHIVRERAIFKPFAHRGMSIVQFRPSRRRRALLLPLAAELIPFGGRLTRRWLGAHTSGYYAAVVRPILEPLVAGADVVHVLGSNVLAVAAVDAAHALARPVAISPFAHLGEWGDDSGSIRAYKRADVLLATTRADADGYRSLGVPDAQIEAVGLPVPDALAPLQESGVEEGDVQRVGESGGGGPLVLYLGQRRPTKRLDLLLAAAERVWQTHPRARFAFVGPGAALAARDERILDVGRVSDAERARWLARADVLCLPSISESFGMVVPEAWSARVPVVVSDIPVLRELIEASAGGLVGGNEPQPFAEAIATLLSDLERARAMGRSGYDYWRAELMPDAVAERHLAVYKRLRADVALSKPAPSTSS